MTVYNEDGLALTRWNSEYYLLDSFFPGKNRLIVVSLAAVREKTDTVFTVFNFKSGEVISSIAAVDVFPLAMSMKQDSTLEVLTSTGALSFNGESAALVYNHPEPSPGVYCQDASATMISYQTLSGSVWVQAFDPRGNYLFGAEYPSVLSLACYADRFFVLTPTDLYVLDSSGAELLRRAVTAAEILASPEISLLLTSSSAEVLDLSEIP